MSLLSHEIALYLNGLAERTPFRYTITIPSNSRVSVVINDACECFYIKRELHKVGLIELTNSFGNTVRTYNPERTICDILRSKNRINYEMMISGLKAYFSSNKKDLNLLFRYAKLFHVQKDLQKYSEVLL